MSDGFDAAEKSFRGSRWYAAGLPAARFGLSELPSGSAAAAAIAAINSLG